MDAFAWTGVRVHLLRVYGGVLRKCQALIDASAHLSARKVFDVWVRVSGPPNLEISERPG